MRLLLDEMYPAALAGALSAAGIDALTASEAGLAGIPDQDLFDASSRLGRTLLTENVADLARISADHLMAGRHHAGVLIALSSRFSRRPSGINRLVAAIIALLQERLDDRVVYLRRADEG